ncbi:sugar ABC transporter permease [Fulvivirga sp. M361]|uniref:ABC transporter permease subunit n=1 Tax=Fulvivirga sp. M361 TaxID=2594266 RepID=UPI00117A4676|nr:ABC transporter permease subunit [Fulvivirga sp. M361]TRX52205.1 sugar ABC transporter permease [Fulvivirga sp. M361]
MRKKTIILIYVLVTLGPLALGLSYSIRYSFGLTGLMNEGFTLTHWIKLCKESDALYSLGYSAWLTIISMLLTLGLSLMLSWWFVRRKGANGLFKSLFLPMLFPPLVAAFAWFYLLSPGGIISRMAYHLHITNAIDDFPRWTNDNYSIGIVITHVFLIFPIFTLLFTAQAQKERVSELMNAALTLGSSKIQFLKRIYIPLLLLKTRPVIWLYGIFLLGTYEVPLLLGQSSPRPVTLFITDKLTRFDLKDIPVGHAMVVVYTLLVLVVIALFVRKKQHLI